jgi:hypothetical protein
MGTILQPIAMITVSIGTMAHSMAMYWPTITTGGFWPGMYEQVKGSFCQL